MKAYPHPADQMTPLERKKAIEEGRDFDRYPAVPFMSEWKCYFSGISIRDFWHDPRKMEEAELRVFERLGQDRIVIGPNTRGIVEALGGEYVYPENGIPYVETPFLTDYGVLKNIEPVDAFRHARIRDFARAAEYIMDSAGKIVPVEASVGGPFTIASNLRGVERLLRDCRKCPEEVEETLRLITESQKSCIDMAAEYGLGIAMADPVANPSLIGAKMYEKFVFPYTKELTEYAVLKTGKKVSLHMCGKTDSIWKYFAQYKLNEVSLDNIVDIEKAALELGKDVPIAGNVDPVQILLNGTPEEIRLAVRRCIEAGKQAKKGYVLATGCDIPETTPVTQVDCFMQAAREYGACKFKL